MIVISDIYKASIIACFVYEDHITHPATVISDKFVTAICLYCLVTK
jgi:hypothetical protein